MGNSWVLTERQKIIDKYLRCAANLYGHITPRAFLVLFNRYNEPKLLKAELMKYWNKLMRQADRNYCLYDNAIISTRVQSNKIDDIMYYQQGKQFYIPTEPELLRYESDNYYEATDFTRNMQEYLCKQLQMNVFSADALLRKLSWVIRTEEKNQQQMDLLEEFHVQLSGMKQANEFMMLLSDMSNNTRKWANCGYTPMELHNKFEEERK